MREHRSQALTMLAAHRRQSTASYLSSGRFCAMHGSGTASRTIPRAEEHEATRRPSTHGRRPEAFVRGRAIEARMDLRLRGVGTRLLLRSARLRDPRSAVEAHRLGQRAHPDSAIEDARRAGATRA